MTTKLYHILLTEEERSALINMQFTGSALALMLRNGRNFSKEIRLAQYYEWAKQLNIVQRALWKQLQMSKFVNQIANDE